MEFLPASVDILKAAEKPISINFKFYGRVTRDFALDLDISLISTSIISISPKMPARGEFSLSVYDYATQWREARASKSCDKIPRPPGATCMLSRHTNNRFRKPQNQDRIYSTYRSAWQHRRSAGYIANIRFESSGLDATKPASAQIALKLMWEDSDGGTRYFFARTTAYASAYPSLNSPLQLCPYRHRRYNFRCSRTASFGPMFRKYGLMGLPRCHDPFKDPWQASSGGLRYNFGTRDCGRYTAAQMH